ncbi:MAG: sulfite exporter TauE/SafE family protein [Chloroflexi bacterium]|nr:sulfite exporter TauE/SafE family protein [Chloroflexota bacterium]
MSVAQVLFAALMLFLGSTALSATGFGIGMVAIPGLLFVLEPQTAVVVLNTIALSIEAWIVAQARKDLPLREIMPVVLAGAVGVPLGVYILKFAEPSAMRIGVSILVLGLAAIAPLKFQRDFRYSRVVGMLAGLFVGIVLPAFGVGGPLVTLFLLTRNWQRQSVRAGMALYLLVLDVFGVAGYAIAGLYSVERLTLISFMILPMLAGLALGTVLLDRMSERVFRYVVVAIILSSSLLLLVRELTDLVGSR